MNVIFNSSDMKTSPPSCIGLANSPFGLSILCWQADALYFLGFPASEDEGLQQFRDQPRMPALPLRNDAGAKQWITRIFTGDIVLARVSGTAFQQQVWQTLCQRTQPGETITYRQLACYSGEPKAYRAVAGALARNPLSWLIPCHRVVHSGGKENRYRWGTDCKLTMQKVERGGICLPAALSLF